VGRILDHLLHTGYAAAAVIEPYFAPIDPVPPRPGVTVDGTATGKDALEWFTAERATLLAAVRLAAKTGFATYTWQLTWERPRHGVRGRPGRRPPRRRHGRGSSRAAPAGPRLRAVWPIRRRLPPFPPRPAAAGDDRRLLEQPGDRPQRPHLDRGAAETPHRHAQPLPASP
jgi:hypothetical protein